MPASERSEADNNTHAARTIFVNTILIIHFSRMSAIASARVRESLRKPPRIAEVMVMAPGFFTPRMVMQVCSASITIITPTGFRPSKSVSAALEELRRNAGTQFDPEAVAAFRNLIEQRAEIPGLELDPVS